MKTTDLQPVFLLVLCASLLFLPACRRDMQDQPKYKPLAASSFFADGRSARPVPEGTIARDEADAAAPAQTGEDEGGSFLATIPLPISAAVLHRGRDRYDIYCSPCHGRVGDGNGMIHKRGFEIPANLHTERLRQVPPGYIYEVISNGYGAMPDHKDQIPPADRWAIVAYVRALQLSRNARMSDVPAEAASGLKERP